MPKKRKKKRTHVAMGDAGSAAPDDKVPRSFVFRRGKVHHSVVDLVEDMRQLMAPHTALRLKERKSNQLKDFLHVAGPLGITHFLIFSQTDMGTNLRLIRTPRGPTLTFRVVKFSLMKDVIAIQRRPHSPANEYQHAPLVVLNNFSGNSVEKQLMSAMLQNMFPPINVSQIKLKQCRRVVLFQYDHSTGHVHCRHYVVTASPVGLSKPVKKIVKAKLPNLHDYDDVSQYVFNPPALSDSEAEDTPDVRVTLAQNFVGKGNKQSQKSAIRLKELGPRLELKLLKIEEEFCDGKVLYHNLVTKTVAEAKQLQADKKRKLRLKEERRRQQEANVKRKQQEKDQRKRHKKGATGSTDTGDVFLDEESDDEVSFDNEDDGDDEEEYEEPMSDGDDEMDDEDELLDNEMDNGDDEEEEADALTAAERAHQDRLRRRASARGSNSSRGIGLGAVRNTTATNKNSPSRSNRPAPAKRRHNGHDTGGSKQNSKTTEKRIRGKRKGGKGRK